ncbi:glycoprotein 3-alpha-L-fucosyltransferase A-like [Pecten maximus]|uniref:glycoprotein 3-alpha-L-fucosyltransferase A-like n=1 Tax=Pecten maximus TaxID=6579 RepID=UPI00145835DF|nr:glycoprotein 3-alpha-L-fucosyltransferase A-like [Pecten maximus]
MKRGQERFVTMGLSRIFRKHAIKVIGILCSIYIWMYVCMTGEICSTDSCEGNIMNFRQNNFVNKNTKKVLVWTKYFFMDWANSVGTNMSRSKYSCSVTSDRSELETADAVLFHFIDLWFWETVPRFRSPNQIWILYNMEAPPHLHFTGVPWIRAFNWTMTYRTDATIHSPYGELVPLSHAEEAVAMVTYGNTDFSLNKTKMAVAVVSDCVDDVQRYRYIQELKKYIDIDYFGGCGDLTCPRTAEAECNSKKYRFRIAFENANCKDYVTEKFWNSLQQESVPIVNWKSNQGGHIPKSSYINIHDFNSAEELGKYLIILSTNKKLYNQYFSWKTKYKLDNEEFYAFKYLCDALHAPRHAQTVLDPNKWLRTDICRTWSIKEVVRRHWDRLMFDMGF